MAKKSSASSRQDVPYQVKNEDIMLDNKVKEELRALKGREIDTSDIPEITDWSNHLATLSI